MSDFFACTNNNCTFQTVIACITPIIKSKAEIKAAIIYFRGKITTLSRIRWPLSHYYGTLYAFAVWKWDWHVFMRHRMLTRLIVQIVV